MRQGRGLKVLHSPLGVKKHGCAQCGAAVPEREAVNQALPLSAAGRALLIGVVHLTLVTHLVVVRHFVVLRHLVLLLLALFGGLVPGHLVVFHFVIFHLVVALHLVVLDLGQGNRRHPVRQPHAHSHRHHQNCDSFRHTCCCVLCFCFL